MQKQRSTMLVLSFICLVMPFGVFGYFSSNTAKDPYISDILLHELVERMGKDLIESDSYMEPALPEKIPSRLALMARGNKDLEAEQLDYDSLLNVGNPNPSLRDQEYLQHSSLWGHHYVTGGTGEIGAHHFKLQPKTDATLPAYCNPPNPCPVGYTEDQGCQLSFENTAAFSRDYQAAQECMCDGEHMFDCPEPKEGAANARQMNSDLESFLARQFHTGNDAVGDKSYVSKKYQPLFQNPYLSGEKLPIAAKKGNNAY